jgi:2-dehydropantoate 2-reductase
MRICVFGVGGVGGYFGGRLAAAGESVAFIARGETLDVLRSEGLRIESPAGDLHLPIVEATDNAGDVGPVDVVILGVKAWQVAEAAAAARPLVGANTAFLPLQNGIEAADLVTAVHGEEHALGGTCRISADLAKPGYIRHVGVDPFIAFGELDNRRSDRVELISTALMEAGITAKIAPDIQSSIWQKFLFVAATSGIGSLARVTLGELRSMSETRSLLREAMEEIRALAAARGVSLADDIVDRTLDYLDGMPPNVTSSMQRDVVEGRPSELEALSGAVVHLGREAGIDTPVHRFIHAALSPLEARARDAR